MDITQILSSLQKVQGFQTAAWERVIRSARAYAQAKNFGTTLDSDGQTSVIPHSNREGAEKYLLDELLRDIQFAFQEDTLVGQELMRVLQIGPSQKG